MMVKKVLIKISVNIEEVEKSRFSSPSYGGDDLDHFLTNKKRSRHFLKISRLVSIVYNGGAQFTRIKAKQRKPNCSSFLVESARLQTKSEFL
jgi:hypothetical protein